MSEIGKVTAELKAIPKYRWRGKFARLAIAAGLAALIVFVAIPKGWSTATILGLAAATGYCVSSDFMKALVGFITAAVRDFVNALRGNGH